MSLEDKNDSAYFDLGGGTRSAMEGTLTGIPEATSPSVLDVEVTVVDSPSALGFVASIAEARKRLAEMAPAGPAPAGTNTIRPVNEGDPVPPIPHVVPYSPQPGERGTGTDPRNYLR
jgi:hypothetical protein